MPSLRRKDSCLSILRNFLAFWDLALTTAIGFVTQADWQPYSGESAGSYFSQVIGLMVNQFLSAATAMAILIAFIRD